MIILEIVAAMATVVFTMLSARGVIHRNAFVGHRTRAILRNDDTWRRGHRAALVPTCVAAFVTSAMGVVFIAFGELNHPPSVILCAVPLVVGAFWGAVVAGRAVR
jgi:amino acid permease